MKPDLYTKVVLTAIALALVQIACNQYVHPATTAQAHGAYAGVQFAGQGDNLWFFDSRTGDVYRYYRSACGSGQGSQQVGGVQREHQTTEKVPTGKSSEEVPINYDDAPRWLEILRFRYDAVLFWFWRRRAALFPSQKG